MTTRAFLLPHRGLLTLFSVLCALCLLAATSGASADDGRVKFDIPASNAASALMLFSTQAGGRVLYSAETVAGVKTNAVRGEMTALKGLESLISGTNLEVVLDADSKSLMLRRKDSCPKKENVNPKQSG